MVCVVLVGTDDGVGIMVRACWTSCSLSDD